MVNSEATEALEQIISIICRGATFYVRAADNVQGGNDSDAIVAMMESVTGARYVRVSGTEIGPVLVKLLRDWSATGEPKQAPSPVLPAGHARAEPPLHPIGWRARK